MEIWHFKRPLMGLEGKLPNFISNFLSDREFIVRVNSTYSDIQEQEMGVPQGSILSVTLFSIKINSLAKIVSDNIEGSLYVDDFLICYRGKNMNNIERQLQLCLNKIEKWAMENGFKFSSSTFGTPKVITSLKWASCFIDLCLSVCPFLL
jgi:hypothetical protein